MRNFYFAKTENNNIPVIESLRGIAASMVCLFHFFCGNISYISNGNIFKQIAKSGWLGVEIFFVISGFVIPLSMFKNEYKLYKFANFLLSRLLRLEPPYLLSIMTVLVLNYLSTLSNMYQGASFILNPIQLSLHLGYLIAFFQGYDWLIPVYWSLAIEFQYYLVISLLFGFINHRDLSKFWLGVFVLLFLALALPNSKHFFYYSPYFVLGFILFRKMKHNLSDLYFYGFAALVLGLIYFQTGIETVLAALLPFILVRFAPNWNPKLLKFLGMISYSLYLIHVPLGGRVINLSARFVEDEWLRVGLVGLLFVVICVTAYGFYWLIEKPAIVWAKRNFKKEGQKEILG